MKVLFMVLSLSMMAAIAVAEKPEMAPVDVTARDACGLTVVTHNWDFAVEDYGFGTGVCDGQGGNPTWQFGASAIPGAPGTVWGTVLGGDYINDTGEALQTPVFTVDGSANMMEILHYVHVETNFDGGNVSVDGQVIDPVAGYPFTISTSTGFYAFCVDNEPGFSGNSSTGPSEAWVVRCWDLSAFDGQDIAVEFNFGTDSSVVYPGWYLAT